jgi:hypothetical protein
MKVGKQMPTRGKSRVLEANKNENDWRFRAQSQSAESERRVSDELRWRVAEALAQVLVHYALGGVFAASAACSNRQFVLYVEE